jgi:ribonuclease BN (tRNA processing enzyme)
VKVVYLTDCELPIPTERPRSELRPMPPELVEFVRGADLLIGDGQYTDDEYAERLGWGHSSCFSVVDLAIQATVKHLALFHHDPARSDFELDELVDACRVRIESHQSSMTVTAAREGVEYRYATMEIPIGVESGH